MSRRTVKQRPELRPGLVLELGSAFLEAREPLARHLASGLSFAVLLKRHGWRADPDALDIERIRPVFQSMGDVPAIRRLVEASRDGAGDEPVGPGDLDRRMVDALLGIPAAIIHLGRESRARDPFPLNSAVFWEEFPRELLDELIVDHFALHRPLDYAPLVLAGLFVEEIVDVRGAAGRDSYSRRRVRWDRLNESVSRSAS